VARGWESKSVEAQQAEAIGQSNQSTNKRSRKMTAAEANLLREKENLRLARQRVMQQLQVSQNPRHRSVLEQALADLDAKLKSLEI
jgi:hypothetical protein